MNVSLWVNSLFSIVFKECNDVVHLGYNQVLEFITFLKCLSVLYDNSCKGESLSREVNFLFNYGDSTTKIIKLFSFI